MKQGLVIAALFFTLCFLTYPSLQAKELKIGVLGDQTGSGDLDQSYQILAQAIDILKKEQVDLVLHVGDLLESSKDEAGIRRDFQTASGLLSRLNVPWYITPGDHDVNPGDWIANSSDRGKERLFRDLFLHVIPALPKDEARLYYSFNYNGYHFVALNALEHLHTDPRWGNVFLARLSEEQLAWLKEDLRRHRDALAIIVFLHQPLWYNQAGWRPVHQLLREYGVRAVIAGHFHYDQDEGEIDGIRYLVIGATGASVKNANPASGGMHQSAVLHVKEGKLFCQLFDVLTGEKTDFTSRADADRVQALDYVLGALPDFSRQNQIFIQNGTLTASCQDDTPPPLHLMGLGNPIDLPVRLVLRAKSADISFTFSEMPDGACEIQGNMMQCELTPGTGIVVSNPATASTCFPSCPASNFQLCLRQQLSAAKQKKSKSFWKLGILSKQQSDFFPEKPLWFRVELSFMGQQGRMSVFRDFQSAPLSLCGQ